MRSSFVALCAVLFLAVATVPSGAAPLADQVTALPLFREKLPSRHFSGYLTALNGSFLHYYFVEAVDVSPSTAPVVWWMNGGPGCSSMDGWGYELGPFTFKNYNATGPVFELNKYSWSKTANLVFVEAPPGVGFSWRENGNYTITDSENARNNFAALQFLFNAKFPEYKNNKFFIAGESYAGIYVPTLAYQVITHPGSVPNFGGILVGNGVTSDVYDNFAYGDARFAYGHGFFPENLYDESQTACIPNENSVECLILQTAFGNLLPNVNIYGSYENCFQQPTTGAIGVPGAIGGRFAPNPSWKHIPALRRRLRHMAQARGLSVDDFLALSKQHEDEAYAKHERAVALAARRGNRHRVALSDPPAPTGSVPPSPPSGDAGVPCIDFMTMKSYLNRQDVKEAIHVQTSLRFDLCYNINYISDILDVRYIYTALLQQNVPVLVYNGNTDMAVPYTGTKAWMQTMNWTTTSAFHAWNFNNSAYPFGPQQAGFATQYDGKLWFVLVNGAGHMVPQTRRPAAFDMYTRFTTGRGF